MFRRLNVALLISSVCSLTFVKAALAWNSPGHMIVALIAYDQMDPATRTKAIELIRSHPRFHDHFESVMPREVSRGDERDKDQWLFAHAATWPDQVRDDQGGRESPGCERVQPAVVALHQRTGVSQRR